MPEFRNKQPNESCSIDSRIRLANLIMRLFELWELSSEDQSAMLGLSKNNQDTLNRYRNGEPFANDSDLIDRAGYLLSIHKALRILYPRNRDLVYRWIKMPNKAFANKSPLEVAKDKQIEGLTEISLYLDSALNC